MDIYRFINSKSIGNYLLFLNYPFNAMEAAWLIYRCHQATIQEKHTAWNELIETMPDCSYRYTESLHDFLRSYMAMENRMIARFRENGPGTFYQDTFQSEKWTDRPPDGYFSDFDHAMHFAKSQMEEDDHWLVCRKLQMNRAVFSGMTAVFNRELEMTNLLCRSLLTEEEAELFSEWENLWFDFPIPFRRGDIVWIPANVHHMKAEGPMVLYSAGIFDKEDQEKRKYLLSQGDETDMCVWAYGIDETSGNMIQVKTENYMDLELYSKPLAGKEKLLQALSDMLRHRCPADIHPWEDNTWEGMEAIRFAQKYNQLLAQGESDQKQMG